MKTRRELTATVVIPTYNRSQRLAELLGCLAAQERGVARVVVCDDGSSDDTAGVARRFERELPLVYKHQENKGFRAGQARNMGIDAAVGDVIIFLDDDLLVAPDFVASHLDAHAGSERPRVHLGLRHRSFGGAHTQPTLEHILASEPDDRVEVLGPDGAGVTHHETPWFFVYSCNFSIARTPEGTPRFDEGFVGWGMEDIEYGYRLHRAGFEVVSNGRARALHIEDPKPRDPFRCEVRQLPPTYDSYVRNSVYFMDLYPQDALLAKMIRQDMRWFVRDEHRDAWVKNGHSNDVEAVLAHCRREREVRARLNHRHTQHTAHRARE